MNSKHVLQFVLLLVLCIVIADYYRDSTFARSPTLRTAGNGNSQDQTLVGFDLFRTNINSKKLHDEVDVAKWCKTHDVLPAGGFCIHKYSGLDKTLAKSLLSILGKTIGDFGAGGGWYTRYFIEHGKESFAYDASPTRGKTVTYLDLSKPTSLGRKFEWVLCLEVGEHIPAKYTDVFLLNVISHAEKGIVMSWAVPDQGGLGHVNNRPNEWVIEKMKGLGWVYDSDASKMLRTGSSFRWFKNTIMVFRNQ
jgi:hypothetical protein